MEGRRKAPIRTYGRGGSSKQSNDMFSAASTRKQPDAFDLLFKEKPKTDDVYDPFAFGDDDITPPERPAKQPPTKVREEKAASKRKVEPSTKPTLNLAPAAAPAAVPKSSSTATVPLSLFGDAAAGQTKRQTKIDQFAIALPRLKATLTPVSPRGMTTQQVSPPPPVAPTKQPSPEPKKEFDAKVERRKEETEKIAEPRPKAAPTQQRQIFTTARNERKKIANPKSWFADDDDEDEGAKAPAHLPKPEKSDKTTHRDRTALVPGNKSMSVSVDPATGKRAVRVARSERDNYAVVKHVRGISELQAEGSSLEYDGDFAYLIECLGTNSQVSSRCLSALQLATKCADTSDFRLYLKSTGKLSEVFSELADAERYDLLALCAATLVLVLASDRSQVDFDTPTLSLLVRLVKLVPASSWSTAVPSQIVDRVTKGISSILKSLHRKYGPDLFSFSPNAETPLVIPRMALAALHTLSQRCSTDTVQTQFREAGAIEILVDSCVACLGECDLSEAGGAGYAKRLKSLISGISKLVAKNKESKRVASECKNNALPLALARFTCALVPDTLEARTDYRVPENKARLLSHVYNLLMVLCCDSKTTCSILSNECPDFVTASARLALVGNKSLDAVHSDFDLSILAFFVLVNIFEFSPVSAAVSHPYGADGPSLLTLLIEYFNFLCAAAADCEREADEQISTSQQQQQQQERELSDSGPLLDRRPSSSLGDKAPSGGDDSAIDAMLQAAGTRHMELNFLAACCSIVIFYAADVDLKGIDSVRRQFSGGNFDTVVDVLKRFLTFTALVNGADDRTLETVAKILEKYDCANRAAGFGLGPDQGGASSSNVASSSFNWATPPGSSASDDDDDDGSSEPKRPRSGDANLAMVPCETEDVDQ